MRNSARFFLLSTPFVVLAVTGLLLSPGCQQELPAIHGNEVTITGDNFDAEVLQSDLPVLVDFGAVWCPPCRDLEPVVAHLSVNYEGRLTVGKVDVDEQQDLSTRFDVTALPTLVLFQNGEEIARMVGYGEGSTPSGLASVSDWVDLHVSTGSGS